MQLTPWSLSARPSRQPGRLGCSRPCPRPRPRRPPSAGAHHPAPGLGTARRERGRAGATGAPCPSGTPGAAASLFSHLSPVKATFQLAGSMLTWGGSHLPEVMKSLCRDEAAPAPRWRGFLPPPPPRAAGRGSAVGSGAKGEGREGRALLRPGESGQRRAPPPDAHPSRALVHCQGSEGQGQWLQGPRQAPDAPQVTPSRLCPLHRPPSRAGLAFLTALSGSPRARSPWRRPCVRPGVCPAWHSGPVPAAPPQPRQAHPPWPFHARGAWSPPPHCPLPAPQSASRHSRQMSPLNVSGSVLLPPLPPPRSRGPCGLCPLLGGRGASSQGRKDLSG